MTDRDQIARRIDRERDQEEVKQARAEAQKPIEVRVSGWAQRWTNELLDDHMITRQPVGPELMKMLSYIAGSCDHSRMVGLDYFPASQCGFVVTGKAMLSAGPEGLWLSLVEAGWLQLDELRRGLWQVSLIFPEKPHEAPDPLVQIKAQIREQKSKLNAKRHAARNGRNG